ncbi:hypothetical protein K504DRAFT_463096 [Pleomassaria siparia CBS 279.74]|uniref:Uncharacterized protein n=1 Tax=Pleomassaria siparia CBS 279.74 TaxID=1314801 RepID=A0A6G1JU43_9PLEO|nr:hypothetical protein K504DRAFT_463096 [Pleomassaria siparia CBS 279.74]
MSISTSTSHRASSASDKAAKQPISVKKIWTNLKHAAVEHHKSVNAAYGMYYSQGRYIPN